MNSLHDTDSKNTVRIITVIGSGYVGVTTAAVAANAGYKVHLIDISEERISVLKSGKSFFYEEGIDSLISKAVADGSLLPSTSYEPGIAESSVVFSCVGTPDNPDGSSKLEYIFAAAKTAAALITDGTVYVQKSTVPVGTGAEVSKLLPENVHYVSNPEFLREGTAVSDTLYFDRIVAGGPDKKSVESVMNIYRNIESVQNNISALAGIKTKINNGQFIATNLESAELIKVTANAFLALKISFANSIAKLADESGADVVDVMDGVGADKRIGRAFLNAGRGYGGGCFPKDVSGLIASASEHGVDMPIMVAATEVNESMPGYIASRAQEALGGLSGKRVAVLGLAFKAGTSDARKSPGVKLANLLDKSGAIVNVYDPHANGEAKEELRKGILISKSATDAINGTDALFIATDWPEFNNLDLKQIASKMKGNHFFDAVNSFTPSYILDVGLQYYGVGRGKNEIIRTNTVPQ
jgi:UDPglucose 6-dehydrogenase